MSRAVVLCEHIQWLFCHVIYPNNRVQCIIHYVLMLFTWKRVIQHLNHVAALCFELWHLCCIYVVLTNSKIVLLL